MLRSGLGEVAVVADEPLPGAEEDEMVGVGVYMPAAGIALIHVHRFVPDERTALEDRQRFIA